MYKLICFVGVLFLLNQSTQDLCTVDMKFSKLKNNKGQIQVSVFRTSKEFENETPYKLLNIDKKKMKNGILNSSLKLKQGTYAIAVVDDENKDGKMNYNIFGYPKEGFGFSNYQHTGLQKPGFSDFKFEVKNTPTKVHIYIRYL